MKLSEIAIKVTNRNRKAVIGWLEDVCPELSKPSDYPEEGVHFKDVFLQFLENTVRSWGSRQNINNRTLVTLSKAKAIYKKENRPQPTHEQLKSERGRSAMYKMKYEQAKSSCHRLNEMLREANEGKQQMVIANGKTIKELDLYKSRVVELENNNDALVNEKHKLHSELLSNERGSEEIIEKLKTKIENQTNFSNDLIEERNGLYASFTKLDRLNSELQDANTTVLNQLSKTKIQRDTALIVGITFLIALLASNLF